MREFNNRLWDLLFFAAMVVSLLIFFVFANEIDTKNIWRFYVVFPLLVLLVIKIILYAESDLNATLVVVIETVRGVFSGIVMASLIYYFVRIIWVKE